MTGQAGSAAHADAQRTLQAASAEATSAEDTLSAARTAHAAQQASAEHRESEARCEAEAQPNLHSAIQAMEVKLAMVAKNRSEAQRKMKSWRSLHSSYVRAAEADEAKTEVFVEQRREGEAQASTLRQQIKSMASEITAAEKTCLDGRHAQALRNSIWLRRLAMTSPILAAWVISAWWLIVPA